MPSLVGFACNRLERRTARVVPASRLAQAKEKMSLANRHKLIVSGLLI
jgi:hypothetical protein